MLQSHLFIGEFIDPEYSRATVLKSPSHVLKNEISITSVVKCIRLTLIKESLNHQEFSGTPFPARHSEKGVVIV